MKIEGQAALVTGGASGLGEATARELARLGAKVAVLGRNTERGQARVKSIQSQGGTSAYFAADALSRCSLAEAHEKLEAAFGPPSILVNAAGGNAPKVTVTPEQPFEQIALADWQ